MSRAEARPGGLGIGFAVNAILCSLVSASSSGGDFVRHRARRRFVSMDPLASLGSSTAGNSGAVNSSDILRARLSCRLGGVARLRGGEERISWLGELTVFLLLRGSGDDSDGGTTWCAAATTAAVVVVVVITVSIDRRGRERRSGFCPSIG